MCVCVCVCEREREREKEREREFVAREPTWARIAKLSTDHSSLQFVHKSSQTVRNMLSSHTSTLPSSWLAPPDSLTSPFIHSV